MTKSITPKELQAKLESNEDIQLIDVREPFERDICSIGGELIPLAELPTAVERVATDKPVVIYCRSGGRSDRACRMLEQQFGYTNVINLEGGVLRWADEVDPSMTKY